ncbi:hypothetical protein M3202_18530 [Alkalihalobacillus oceani]|uniref:Uncharacterized protein n=1 Tax=Halalkalibacter oceani TaxID=1653776 RepID=A0A9X2DV17_9BACI|nr:hypothetical protein [Halalkalibacter oceani]MCM3716052.1 hypothetical protein [Halalkalibacter oceani]
MEGKIDVRAAHLTINNFFKETKKNERMRMNLFRRIMAQAPHRMYFEPSSSSVVLFFDKPQSLLFGYYVTSRPDGVIQGVARNVNVIPEVCPSAVEMWKILAGITTESVMEEFARYVVTHAAGDDFLKNRRALLMLKTTSFARMLEEFNHNVFNAFVNRCVEEFFEYARSMFDEIVAHMKI